MTKQNIFPDKITVFLFVFIVSAGILPDHAVPENNGQIPKLQSSQKDSGHMAFPIPEVGPVFQELFSEYRR